MTARATLGAHTVLKYLFTSGSTGSPKAVINTNGMVTANQAMIRDCYRFLATEPPIVLDWAPWNHTAAGNKVTYMVLTNGGTYYIDDGKPTADGFRPPFKICVRSPAPGISTCLQGTTGFEALEADKGSPRPSFPACG